MVPYDRPPTGIIQGEDGSISCFREAGADGNIDWGTVGSFGDEWGKFRRFDEPELRVPGDQYFDVVEDGMVNPDSGWHFPSLRNQHKAIAEGNFLSCIGNFLHRDIYGTYRFDTNPVLTGSEDWEFWLRVAADHEVQRIPRVNSGVVHHEQRSMTRQDLATAEKRIEYILEKVDTDPHLRKVYGRYRRMMRSSSYVFLGGIANDNRTPGPAFDHLRRALIAYPRIVGNWRFLRTLQLAFLNKMSG